MNQAELIMNKAASYIGTAEDPPGSNNVIFNTHYYGGAVSGDWYPWCCAFVWDIFRMCGLSGLFYDGQKTAYCPAVYSWAKQNGLVAPKETARYGDIALFDWDSDGVADHIGFVEAYNGVNYTTIEGNTSTGNDSNGGQVMRRTRYASQIQAIVRPKYTGKTPGEAKEGVPKKQDKTQQLFIGKVTADELNVRTWAGTEYQNIRSYPVLKQGELVDVMNFTQKDENGEKWYYIRIAGQYHGFVHSKYIERQ